MTAGLPVTFGADLDRDARRTLVEGSTKLDGIDFVEVLSNHRGTPGFVRGAPSQRTLLVHLLNKPVPTGWRADRVVIGGGVRADPRVNPVGIGWAYPALAVAGAIGVPRTEPLADVVVEDRALVDAALPRERVARERVFVVRTTTSGDWSTYVLYLLGAGGRGVPAGFDPPLAGATFTFTVDCPNDLDCCSVQTAPQLTGSSPVLDYLARDYDALRTRLLDRLATLLPGWTDRNPADPAVTMIELFAYLGDRLAYWQDAVAVEAYLATARQRTSVRRHARLLNYTVHEGCSARVWLAMTTPSPVTLMAGAAVSDTSMGSGLLPIDAHEAGAVVMQTCTTVRLLRARNGIELHSWGDPDHILPAGSTSAYLAVPTSEGDPALRAGDVIILADSPVPRPATTGPGDPTHIGAGHPGARFAVRLDRDPVARTDAFAADRTILEIHWHPDDALPNPLRVTEPAPGGAAAVRAVALANVVLADHGASVAREMLDPPQPPAAAEYHPRLARTGLTFAAPVSMGRLVGATASARPDPRAGVAQLDLDDGQRTWLPRTDLVASTRLDPHFVVEPAAGGAARLRFGDGVTGRAPTAQATYTAGYRVGGGLRGNVAAGRLLHWLPRADGRPAEDSGAALTVWNPIPAVGGVDPEPLDAVRQLAPSAYRRQLRAVTSPDYAHAANTVSGVQRSIARRRWTGSWYAQEVTVDPMAGRADDPAVPAAVTAVLEVRRMAGVDVEVARPVYVPLHIELFGCVVAGFARSAIEAQLLDVLSSRVLPGGVLGFFHPDRFTFGQPVYLSDVVAAAMAVPGLSFVDVRTFARLAAPASASAAALRAGRIDIAPREVLRCDSDPNNPEAGRVDIVLGGRP